VKANVIRPRKSDPTCVRCNLHQKSKTVCCEGSGPLDAPIFLFGEALGANEEQQGKPFVGDAGWKLSYCLARAGLKRKQLRIENTVRCRPPGNKNPTTKQISACYGYLLRTILVNRPKVVVALGSIAFRALTGSIETNKSGDQKIKLNTRSVTGYRGFYERATLSWTSKKGKTKSHSFWLVPTNHPSACLHKWELDDLLVFDLSIAKQLAEGKEPLKAPGTKVRIAKTFNQAIALMGQLQKQRRFAFDLEATSLSPYQATIMCFGFCFKSGEAWILPWNGQGPKPWWKPKQKRKLLRKLTRLFETSSLVGQNIKFDLKLIRRLTGLTDFDISFDTMIAHANIDENKPHGLTFLCQWYLRWKKYDDEMSAWKTKAGKRTIFKTWEVPNEKLWTYCGYDVDGNWRVRKKLLPLLQQEGVIGPFRNHMGLIHPLMDAEYRGLRADPDRLRYLGDKLRADVEKIKKRLRKKADRYLGEVRDPKGNVVLFNPGSPVQLVSLLTKAGAKLTKKTPNGLASTDKFVLEALSLQKTKAGSIARDVVRLRKLSGYVTKNLDGSDGAGAFVQHLEGSRWHPTYNIHIARTGRQSAHDPPVQTLPRTGGIRSIIVPDSPDHILLSADYNKVELCVLSWLSNEEIMIRELSLGIDLHTRMAVVARLMRDPTEEEWHRLAPLIGKDERSIAKGSNFGIPYGRGAYAIAEENPDAFPLGMPKYERTEKVQRVIDAYFSKYQMIAAWRDQQVELAEKHGFIRSAVFNRKRRFLGVRWFLSKYGLRTRNVDRDLGHLHRECYNFQVQAIAGDVMSRATKRVYDGIKKARIPGLRIILTLHDQLVFSCYRKHAKEASSRIVGWMADTLPKGGKFKFEMPLRVECDEQPCFGYEYFNEEEKAEYEQYQEMREAA
jgi:uracil-DNA glycosylase family 4